MFSLAYQPCDMACPTLAIGEDSHCDVCNKITCREHYDDPAHTCGYTLRFFTGSRRLPATLADLDEKAIARRVADLRPDARFKVIMPKTFEETLDLSGGFNMHVEAAFEDGVQWLVRISKYGKGDGPMDLWRNNLESEALTYKLLYDHGIPVPVVHDWGMGEFSKTQNPLCRHIIYDRMPGTEAAEHTCGLSEGAMSREDMKVFVDDFADISVKISKIPCDAIGSLCSDDTGEAVWGPHLNGGYTESLEAPYFGGPFYTLRDRFIYRIDSLIDLTKQGLIHRLAPLFHYLALMEARRLVMTDPVMSRRDTTFYIRHPDCSGSNILAGGNKITGLIDWEWTTSTTLAGAFAAPKWAYNTDAYLDGNNSQTPEEDLLCEAYERLERPDLAEFVRGGGRRYQRLQDLLFHLDPYHGEANALGQVTGLTRAFEGEDRDLPITLADWIEWAKGMNEGNPDLVVIVGLDERFRKLRHRQSENAACEGIVPNLLKCSDMIKTYV